MSINKSQIIYLAAPFFNDEEKKTLDIVESILDDQKISYFSPRSEGVLTEMSIEEKRRAFKAIFDSNVRNIRECEFVLACIDKRHPKDNADTGTMFEVGFAYGIDIPVVTYSRFGHGCNVMITQSASYHLHNMDEVREFLSNINNYKKVQRDMLGDESVSYDISGMFSELSIKRLEAEN